MGHGEIGTVAKELAVCGLRTVTFSAGAQRVHDADIYPKSPVVRPRVSRPTTTTTTDRYRSRSGTGAGPGTGPGPGTGGGGTGPAPGAGTTDDS